ncbi:MAG: hypothetical protein ACUVX8_08190 [Candidatus Zipacnadales bacterium]
MKRPAASGLTKALLLGAGPEGALHAEAVAICASCVGDLLGLLSLGAQDILIADFEGTDYSAWEMRGEVLGSRPAIRLGSH